MAVKPIGVGPVNVPGVPIPQVQNNLITQAQQVVDWHFSHAIDDATAFETAQSLVEQAKVTKNFSLRREILCLLYQINNPQIESYIWEQLEIAFDFSTITYDVQQNQYAQLLHLEQLLNTVITVKVTTNSLDKIGDIVASYLRILERLWIIPYFEQGTHFAQLRDQNKANISSHVDAALQLLSQVPEERGFDRNILACLAHAAPRIFDPFPASHQALIEREKVTLHTRNGISPNVLYILAEIYRDQNDYYQAVYCGEMSLQYFNKAIKDNPRRPDRAAVLTKIMYLNGDLSFWCQILKRFEASLAHGKQALLIAKSLGEVERVLSYLKGLGGNYTTLGRLGEAIACYEEAKVVAKRLHNQISEHRILLSLVGLYISNNKYGEASKCLDEASPITQNEAQRAALLAARYNFFCFTLRFDEARKALLEELTRVPAENYLGQSDLHERLGDLYCRMGIYEKAIDHANKALELAQKPVPETLKTKVVSSVIGALMNLGKIYGTLGDFEREHDFQQQAMVLADKRYTEASVRDPELDDIIGNFRVACVNLGNALCHLNKFSESLPHYVRALRHSKIPLEQGPILIDLGHAFNICEMYQEAIEHYEKSLKVDNEDIQKNSLNGLGLAYGAIGNRTKAIQCLNRSVELCRKTQDRPGEAAALQNLGEYYRKAKEFDLAERNYRRSLDVFASLQQEIGDYSQWQITVFEEMCKPYVRLESLLFEQGRTEEAFEAMEKRRARALNFALIRKFPASEQALLNSKIVKLSDAQEYAKSHNTVLIFYSFAMIEDGKIAVWVVSPNGKMNCYTISHELIKAEMEDLAKLFEDFPFMNKPVSTSGTTDSQPQAPTNPRLAAILDRARKKAADGFKTKLMNWYNAFILPIEADLAQCIDQKLTIFADDYLFKLPFALFLDKDGKYLIEKHPIALAPSLKFLQLLSLLKNEASNQSLIIGNPDTGEIKDRLEKSEKEVEDLGKLLHANPDSIFIHKKATVEVTTERLPRARWIHLACHGLPGPKLDPHSVFEGAFKLAPTEACPEGYLFAQKIVELKLRAELVFLNACYSGVGKVKQEGSIGHIWSFLAAGAKSVIAAHWKVPEADLTLQMIETFYKHTLGLDCKKLDKSEALRKAMLLGMEKSERENPHAWGLLYLTGLE